MWTIDKVYIVVQLGTTAHPENIIESVWSTEELARGACHYHAHNCNIPVNRFMITEREINTAKQR